ncbi:hypothetical protein UA08_03016 [Talaromyces atroroseus]|uniref:phosphatidylinositol-3,4,5-trisphosphate 3-phosphatase n=1 Tax=Talaromyces atroroseus TaxID=1441469 RepID=A0A225AU93_TALAT|nr:hypothetical protein UA08_03016 [Talaromyces atroroseus]OKL61934.1 hypothetical protein UA08_03016 [Talaromyces atroroseus]
MASLLRQIVAGPRIQHPEAGLDLCYVTDFLIATSGPSSKYPKRAYRNPTDALVRFLDAKHGEDWAIWEFRAEGTGYPDSEVYGRIHHFPWPDHHPPPFALIPAIMASMRNWLLEDAAAEEEQQSQAKSDNTNSSKRVAVVHCKAGKGRSGTIACSYLISQEGWKLEDALRRFTERRMRVGFGEGVSISSQRRWIGYVNRWANEMGKIYVERPVEILEVHVWGLRDGVKIAIEGYVDEGKKIKSFHLFKRRERIVVDDGNNDFSVGGNTDIKEEWETNHDSEETHSPSPPLPPSASSSSVPRRTPTSTSFMSSSTSNNIGGNNGRISAAILRPAKPVILPTSDVNIDFERRIKASYTGWAMVTSIAHVWFNAYFEGGDKHDSGIFECEWDGLDGIKGSGNKGTKALERVKVVWRYPSKEQLDEAQTQIPQKISAAMTPTALERKVLALPKPGEPVHESNAADWHGENVVQEDDSETDFAGHKNVANPTGSPVRPEGRPQKMGIDNSNAAHSTGEKEEVLKGTTHHFAAGASATTAAAVSSAAKKVRRQLGLRKQTDASRDVSLASSVEDLTLKQQQQQQQKEEQREEQEELPEEGDGSHDSDIDGVKSYYKNGNNIGTSGDGDTNR